MFQSTAIPVLEQVVDFTESRHAILAGNLANIDTPGYRTRDLSTDLFNERLREAIHARDTGRPASLADASTNYQGNPLAEVSDEVKTILFHDDSNVGPEQQMSQIVKNQMLHSVALTIMTSQFQLLEAAISERA